MSEYSSKVVILNNEDTGLDGDIQIYTKFNNNYYVKYFQNSTHYDNYLTVSLNDFTITANTLNISEHTKKMILMYIIKNSKPIHTFYYHGINMNCRDTLELFEQLQALTSEDVNACLLYKL